MKQKHFKTPYLILSIMLLIVFFLSFAKVSLAREQTKSHPWALDLWEPRIVGIVGGIQCVQMIRRDYAVRNGITSHVRQNKRPRQLQRILQLRPKPGRPHPPRHALRTPTRTSTPTSTWTPSPTASYTPTFTPTASNTPIFTSTASSTPTFNPTASQTSTFTPTVSEYTYLYTNRVQYADR